MSLVRMPVMQFIQLSGIPYALATAQFYLTGTSTPCPVYADADLEDTLTNPVVANDQGIFPPIYLDQTSLHRLVVMSADGSDTLCDVDPVDEPPYVLTAAEIDAALGYTPVDPAAAVFTAPARLTFSPAPVAFTEDSVGYLGSPHNIQDEDYTFAITDAGCMIVKDDDSEPTWTIPPSTSVAFPIGTELWLANIGTNDATLTPGSGVTLNVAGSPTSGSVYLSPWALVILKQIESDQWVVMGDTGTASSGNLRQENNDYTLAASDDGAIIQQNTEDDFTWTIPSNANVALPLGFRCTLVNAGSGGSPVVTVARDDGVTLNIAGNTDNHDLSLSRTGVIDIIQVGADTWYAIGGGVT